VKGALRFLFKAALFVLLLPLMVVIAIFLYATFANPGAQQTMEKMTDFLENRRAGGNGFGFIDA